MTPQLNWPDLLRKRGNVRAQFSGYNMTPTDNFSALKQADVQRRFDRAAPRFDGADFVHATTRKGLLQRLAPIAIEASKVVDLGSATGSALQPLRQKFRKAHIIATDLSGDMLAQAGGKLGWFSGTSLLQADARALPFADQSIDVVFSNLMLPWLDDPAAGFTEMARVLRRDGLFIFATLGPDSLNGLRHAWHSVDDRPHVNRFLDMHDIGDAAVRAGLRDPVLDVDRLTVTYADSKALFQDLTATGGRNSLLHRDRSLAAARRFQAMTEHLEQQRQDGLLSVELELVFGHCWGSGALKAAAEVFVPATRIGRRNR
jgi:malonyl-CoA O-methyltransferase